MDAKSARLVVVIILLVGLAVAEAVALWTQNRVADVRAQVAAFDSYRDSVQLVVALRDSIVAETEATIAEAERIADSLRAELARTDSIVREQRLAGRKLASFEGINERFDSTFPIFSSRSFRMKYAPEPGPDSLDHIVMPTAFLTTFVEERLELVRLRSDAQVAQRLDSANVEVIEGQDTIIGLLEANQLTLSQAFDTTSTLYRERSEELIEELRKPDFRVGLGAGIAGGVLVGILAAIAAGN